MLLQLRLRPFFFIPCIVFLVFTFAFCTAFSKDHCFLFLNSYHNTLLDAFFLIYTHVGDGVTIIALALLLLIVKKRKESLTLFISYVTSGICAQLLKHLFSEPRPVLFLKQSIISYSHFVDGATLYTSNSFPSGHSTSAFAMATIIALCSRKKSLSILAFFFAILVGYSRIYLAEHFLTDVLAGAFIGILFGMISYYLVWQLRLKISLSEVREKIMSNVHRTFSGVKNV